MDTFQSLEVASQLAAGIAQEIHSPLVTLKELSKSSESMTSELDRIEAMINEVLILVPTLTTEFVKVDVITMLQDVIALFEPQATLKKVEILVEFSVPVLFIPCVPVQIKQLFINILSNGMDAMSQGGNMIIKLKVDDGKTAVISFNDSGAEVTKNKLLQLNGLAKSAKESREKQDRMVNHKIIEGHQGEISFKSNPGKGTLVEIELNI